MNPLQSEILSADPRVAEAKRLLRASLEDRRQAITGIRPPDPGRAQSYEQALKRLAEMRGMAPYFPYLGSGAGNGPLVELLDGSVKYDFITGIGVHGFGHSAPEILEAAVDAALQDTSMQGFLMGNADAAGFLDLLLGLANQGGAALAHGYLTTSGAMANENALKIAFQKRQPAGRVLAFAHCFAGRTLALSQVTDKPDYRQGLPPILPVDYVPFFDPADAASSTDQALRALDGHLAAHPGGHACMILELIQGEGGGYAPAPREFFLPLLDRLRREGVPILFDEIQTFGRTTRPFCFQHLELDAYADIVTVGKLTQACATMIRGEFKPGPGLISQTFTASTLSIRAGRALVEHLVQCGHFGPQGRNAAIRVSLVRRLEDLARKYPDRIAGPWGEGLMVAFTPLGGDADKVKAFILRLFRDGVIAFTAGSKPTRARFLVPPAAIEERHLDEAFAVLEKNLAES